MGGRHRTESGDNEPRRSPRPLAFAVFAVAAVVLLGVGGYLISRPTDAEPTPAPSTTATTAELAASFDALDLRAPTGIAIVPVGGGDPLLFGDQHVHDAWSTIKAPIGLAAERKHGMSRTEADAVIDSDNESARILTRSLGSPVDASQALETVLREGGDSATVPAARHGADYPMLGETSWSLADSATWTAHLPCLTGSDHILELMRDVSQVQEWGLRRVGEHTPVKGGWGEMADGGYVVRQIGVVGLPGGGRTAVSISTHEPGMAFESGTRTLDRVATWLNSHLQQLPGGTCR